MNKKTKKSLQLFFMSTCIISIALLSIYYAGAFSIIPINSSEKNTSAENVEESISLEGSVEKYIIEMKNQNFSNVLEMIRSNDIGYDAKIYNYKDMNEHVNDPVGLDILASSTDIDIVASQYEYTKEKFGEDAWDHVTYKIVKTNCPSKYEEYVNTETGEAVSENEMLELNEKFWRNFAAERGIEYSDFISTKEKNENVYKEENMTIMEALSRGYEPTVKVMLVDAYDYYIAYLSFNGASETNDGEKSFQISVDNMNGEYEINYGLRWEVPLSPENMAGD